MQPARIDRQPAYVLHTQAYKETSLLVEVLTRDHGRFTLVARGARRPRSDLRGLLLPFQPLQLSWFGKNELRTLHAADWRGGVPQFAGERLVCGFYLNELVLRLAARDDPAPELFLLYDRSVRALAGEGSHAGVLRRFELALLQVLGYAPELAHDADGQAVSAAHDYCCRFGALPRRATGTADGVLLPGVSLLALAAGDLSLAQTRRDARLLTRAWLDELLGSPPLASRDLLTTLYALAD